MLYHSFFKTSALLFLVALTPFLVAGWITNPFGIAAFSLIVFGIVVTVFYTLFIKPLSNALELLCELDARDKKEENIPNKCFYM